MQLYNTLSTDHILDYDHDTKNLWKHKTVPNYKAKHGFRVTRLQIEFSWSRTENGVYSARSAYNSYFLGAVQACYANLLWKSWAPLKEKVFTWLALRGRCWTGDRLSKRRLAGPARCFLCDQRTETLNHLMVQCPTSR
jgi:hypothetical protein